MDDRGPGWFAGGEDVIAAVGQAQDAAGYLRGQFAGLLGGHPLVAAGVQDQGGAAHAGGEAGHVDAGEGVEEAHDVAGGGGGPLQGVESIPGLAGLIGQELGGEHLAVGGIVAALGDPANLKVQRRFFPLLGGPGPGWCRADSASIQCPQMALSRSRSRWVSQLAALTSGGPDPLVA